MESISEPEWQIWSFFLKKYLFEFTNSKINGIAELNSFYENFPVVLGSSNLFVPVYQTLEKFPNVISISIVLEAEDEILHNSALNLNYLDIDTNFYPDLKKC